MHTEYINILDNADTAVLFIHGICGTPNSFEEFVKLTPKNLSVYNMLLDGHGKGVSDFSKTSMAKWEQQVDDTVKMLLNTHKDIIIVAHSMGTLFAIEQAIKHKAKIKALFLLAVPVKISVKLGNTFISLKTSLCKHIDSSNPKLAAARRAYGIESDWRIWRYLGWIPRYLELFSKSKEVRQLIDHVNVPCHAYFSAKDEVVSLKSGKLFENNNNVKISTLENSGHYYHPEAEFKFLLSEFKELFKGE